MGGFRVGSPGVGGTSTSWPSALTVDAAFDTGLMESYGEGMGSEFYGSDRPDLTLGKEDALITAVADVAGDKTVVVAVTPGALLTPWRDNVSAILTPFMPGQEYGNAITGILFGDANPSGKLPITFPNVENEMGLTQQQWPGVNLISVYSEALEVGYRWYGVHGVKPAFAFGHGLSYTKFAYSNLKISGRTVSCTVQNVGSVKGAEVAQLYLDFPQTAGEPPKQLKGFKKVSLAPKESTIVDFELDDRSFSIWDVSKHAWAVEPGKFWAMIGSSVEDIRLRGQIDSGSSTEARIVV